MPDAPVLDYARPAPTGLGRRVRLYVVLLLIGLAFLFWTGLHRQLSIAEICVALLGLTIGVVPWAARRVDSFSQYLDGLDARRHRILIAVLAGVLPLHLLSAAWLGHRPLVPLMHDEQMYLLQARQLASGHLTMPALPMGEFFDTFYVFVKPVYASMYFPGTSLAYVPSLWLDLPYFVWPVLIMTGLCVMTYVLAAHLLGRMLGLVTMFVMLAADPMNWLPTATMSHPLGGLFGTIIIYAWLRWRAAPRIGWAALLGAAAGWMAITRPLESLCFGVPIAIAIAVATRRETARVTIAHAALAIACATPFLTLQLLVNHAVTGQWSKLPITFYNEQQLPGMTSLGKADVDLKPTSTLPQKQAMMNAFVTPMLKKQAAVGFVASLLHRTVFILGASLASPLLFALLPLAWPLLRGHASSTGLRMAWAIFLLFTLAYGFYGGYLMQYSTQVMPLVAIMVIAGAASLARSFPGVAANLRAGYSGLIVGLTIVVLCIMPKNGSANGFDWSVMRYNYETLPNAVQKPALVLIRYGPKSSPFAEPVYNIETAWPDDAQVIRAHDFGPQRDLDLLRYYAAVQPRRFVYVYDRDSATLTPLGPVGQLVRRADTPRPATQPATSAATMSTAAPQP